MIRTTIALSIGILASYAAFGPTNQPTAPAPAPATNPGDPAMRLGNFSLSLSVKDIKASQAFYEKLGFKQVSGDPTKNWVVMQSESCKIGLFQGMFPKNTLTFNPGWDSSKNTLAEFTDVRELQRTLKARGLTPAPAADESTTGPAYFMIMDPDGNPVLFDQHVASPKK
jgi:predicted lactoylglutathione lyase